MNSPERPCCRHSKNSHNVDGCVYQAVGAHPCGCKESYVKPELFQVTMVFGNFEGAHIAKEWMDAVLADHSIRARLIDKRIKGSYSR